MTENSGAAKAHSQARTGALGLIITLGAMGGFKRCGVPCPPAPTPPLGPDEPTIFCVCDRNCGGGPITLDMPG